jgi:hypothetical protein
MNGLQLAANVLSSSILSNMPIGRADECRVSTSHYKIAD